MKMRFSLMFACAGALFAAASVSADDVATCWAEDTIAVDAEPSFRVSAGEITLGYSTDWCTGTNVAGAAVVLKAVSDPESANAVTTTLSLAEGADLSHGALDYEGSGYTRFILSAELDGQPVGNLLVSDVSFGAASSFTAAMPFDGRTNSLQEVMDARATASLRYDLLWGNVASNAEISLVRVRRRRNVVLETVTNSLYDVDAFHAGDRKFSTSSLQWGDHRLLLREYAADGSLLLEMLSPEFSIPHVFGTYLIVR
jgi:hypothetical protein